MTPITISQLEQAINTARSIEPSAGDKAALSADVTAMASIYGVLIYRGHKNFDVDSLPNADRDSVLRWLARSDTDRAA